MKLMTQAGIAVLIFLGGVALLMIMVAWLGRTNQYGIPVEQVAAC
jgi:hypothetical protein